MKRYRNTKIENLELYDIVREEDLDINLLSDYEQQISTGMEAEEEKEHHLKEALKAKNLIPLPKIESEEILIQYEPYDYKDKYIEYEQDVKNIYIPEEEDEKILDQLEIKESLRKKIFESKQNEILDVFKEEQNRKFIDVKSGDVFRKESLKDNTSGINKNSTFIDTTKRTSLINEDMDDSTENRENILFSLFSRKLLKLTAKNDNDAYLCFRKRIIKSARKNRRNESICIENIKNIRTDLLITKKIFDLKKNKYFLEEELLKVKENIRLIFKNLKVKSTSKSKEIKESFKKGTAINTYTEYTSKNSTAKENIYNIYVSKNEFHNFYRLAYTNKKVVLPFFKSFTGSMPQIEELKKIINIRKIDVTEDILDEEVKILKKIKSTFK